MKATLIVNPVSGTHDKRRISAHALSLMQAQGWEAEVAETQRAGHATELAARAAARGSDLVIAVGGDGTVNETAKALTGTSTALGIIPCGSGNGLARHLGIPMNPAHAVNTIIHAPVATIDSGEVNGRPFFCTCGVGLDAQVSHDFARRSGRGFVRYLQSTFDTYRAYKPENYVITLDDTTLTTKALLIAVCNASQYGNNTYIAPKASVTDGLLDVAVIHPGNLMSIARAGLDIMAGLAWRAPIIEHYKARKVVIDRRQSGAAHADGEPIILSRHLEIECHRASLRVVTPCPDPHLKPLLCIFNR